MRVDDVPIEIANGPRAHARPSAGFAVDAMHAASPPAPLVAIESWSVTTVLGRGLLGTYRRLLDGDCIADHTRVADVRAPGRAAALARFVAGQLTCAGFSSGAAVVVGTSKGSVEDWFDPPPVTSTSDNPHGGLSVSGLGDIAAAVSRACRTNGPVLTVSAACASGLHALIRAAMMIRAGEVRQALVVATEASVHPLFLANFQRLGVLAQPGAGCRPFDRNRSGFYMSEAAAAVLLEAAEPDGSLRSRRAGFRRHRHLQDPVYIDRFALGGDATHLTGGDPGARVLRHLLHKVIDGRPVNLIHAHGTGTELNDATELAAIESAVGDSEGEPPVVYSHKAALGHSLGASGLVSVVLNCAAHTTGRVPPNARTTDPVPTRRVVIPPTPTERRIERSLAIAAGFGGPTAVVSLTSVP